MESMDRKKRNLTESEKIAIIKQLKWSGPESLKKWAEAYKVHPNTMHRWLKDDVLINQQVSPRRWRIAIEDLPGDLVINALMQK